MSGGMGHAALPSENAGGRPSARRARKSADQQQAAAAGLDLLRVLGWLVLHDVAVPERPGSPIDHVIVGPSGVYVIHDEAWSGTIAFREEMVLVNGAPQLEATAQISESAAAVRALLGGLPVVGVLCLERPEAVAGLAGDIAVCSTENILDLLTTQPGLLDTATQHQLSRSLRSGLRAVGPRVPAPLSVAPTESGPTPARHKDRSRIRLRRTTPEATGPRHAAAADEVAPAPQERPVQPVEGALPPAAASPAPEAQTPAAPAPAEDYSHLIGQYGVLDVDEPPTSAVPSPGASVENSIANLVHDYGIPDVAEPIAPRIARAPAAPTAAERRALVSGAEALEAAVYRPSHVAPVAAEAEVEELEAIVDAPVEDAEIFEPFEDVLTEDPDVFEPFEDDQLTDDPLTDDLRAAEEAAELAEIEEARLALQAAMEQDRLDAERRREDAERRQLEMAEARIQASRDRAARESAVAEQIIFDRVSADQAAQEAAARAAEENPQKASKLKSSLPARFAGRDIPPAPVAVEEEPAEKPRRTWRRSLMPPLVAALMVVVIVGIVPRVPAAITWAQIQLGKTPTYDIGASAAIGANAYHPALDLRPGNPVRTEATAGAVPSGQDLFAVPIRIQNNGSLAWTAPLGERVKVIDSLGIAHPVATGVTGLKAGRLIANPLQVAPGHYATGLLPVAVPAGRGIAEIRIDLGEAKGDKVVWKAP